MVPSDHNAHPFDAVLFQMDGGFVDGMDDGDFDVAGQLPVEIVGGHAGDGDELGTLVSQGVAHPDHLRQGIGLGLIENIARPVGNGGTVVNDHIQMLLVGFRVGHPDDELHEMGGGDGAKAADDTECLHLSHHYASGVAG